MVRGLTERPVERTLGSRGARRSEVTGSPDPAPRVRVQRWSPRLPAHMQRVGAEQRQVHVIGESFAG